MRRRYSYYLLLLVLIAAFVIKRVYDGNRHSTPATIEKQQLKKNQRHEETGLLRDTALLHYSKHARCRMDCRHISPQEVKDILLHGHINYQKSDLQNDRCPRYAVEGITSDRQQVRIIFAQCSDDIVVVTAIDLDTHWQCHCPGDEN